MMSSESKPSFDVGAMAYRGHLQKPFHFKPSAMGKRCINAGSDGALVTNTPDGKYALLLSENMVEGVSEPAQGLLLPGESLDFSKECSTLQIKARIESDPGVKVDLLVMFYDEKERIATWFKGGVATSTNLLRVVPANTRSLGVVIRMTGIGSVNIDSMKLTLHEKHESDVLAHEIAMQQKAQFLDAHGLQDIPKYIDSALYQCLMKNPSLASSPKRLMHSLVANRYGYAMLDLIERAPILLSDERTPIIFSALYNLREMQGIVDAYDQIDQNSRINGQVLKCYLLALVATKKYEQFEQLLKAFLDRTNVPNAAVQAALVSCEILDDSTLSVLSKIVANFSLKNTDFTKLLYLYDVLHERGLVIHAKSVLPRIEELANNVPEEKLPNLHILNANIAFRHGQFDEQYRLVNAALADMDLLPIVALDRTKPCLASNITVPKNEAYEARRISEGPLVSVIMTAFNAEDSIGYALGSLLNQTYANLEILVVNDQSTDDTLRVTEAIAVGDHRVRVITMDVNGGCYRAKNEGLAQANGKYVLSQDSDDWAHPEKIARLVDHMETHDEACAVEVSHIRLSAKFGIMKKLGLYLRKDSSSMTFARKPVVNTIGFYDSVRTGADSEFKFRLERAFPNQSVHHIPLLCSFVASDDATLSGGGGPYSISPLGVFGEERARYRQSFQKWHERQGISGSSSALFMPQYPDERPFDAPESNLP